MYIYVPHVTLNKFHLNKRLILNRCTSIFPKSPLEKVHKWCNTSATLRMRYQLQAGHVFISIFTAFDKRESDAYRLRQVQKNQARESQDK